MSVAEALGTQTVPTPTKEGEHDLFAHYVVPAEDVMRAMVTGEPCTALCGKTWVPSRDPLKYPICAECKRLHERYFGT